MVGGRISKIESQWTIIRGVLSTESGEAGVSIVTSAVPVGYESSFESTQLGLTVNEFYAGGFLHADDIRTLANSEASLQA